MPEGMAISVEALGDFVARALGARGVPDADATKVADLMVEADVYGHGKPTRIANSDRDLRQPEGSLPVTEASPGRSMSIPWFKHYRPEIIEEHAEAFVKVANHADEVPRG